MASKPFLQSLTLDCYHYWLLEIALGWMAHEHLWFSETKTELMIIIHKPFSSCFQLNCWHNHFTQLFKLEHWTSSLICPQILYQTHLQGYWFNLQNISLWPLSLLISCCLVSSFYCCHTHTHPPPSCPYFWSCSPWIHFPHRSWSDLSKTKSPLSSSFYHFLKLWQLGAGLPCICSLTCLPKELRYWPAWDLWQESEAQVTVELETKKFQPAGRKWRWDQSERAFDWEQERWLW